jgi:hypothetical protein
VTRIGELGIMLVIANVAPSSSIPSKVMVWEYVPPKRRLLKQPHG